MTLQIKSGPHGFTYVVESLDDIAAHFDSRADHLEKRIEVTLGITGREKSELGIEARAWRDAATVMRNTTLLKGYDVKNEQLALMAAMIYAARTATPYMVLKDEEAWRDYCASVMSDAVHEADLICRCVVKWQNGDFDDEMSAWRTQD